MRLPARWRQDTAAYASYLRGLALRFTAPPDVARDTFAALVARNPLYAPGLSGLAHAYAMSTVFGKMPPEEGWPKVEAAARRAIALDSASASAYLALGLREIWRWNLPRGGQLIDRGLALEPDDPEAHALRGLWFRWRRELDSNVEEARKSTKLDPLNPYWVQRLARQLYVARRYPESENMYRQLIREYPKEEELYGELSDVYRAMDRPLDALKTLRESWEAVGNSAALAEFPATSDSQAARIFAGGARQDLHDLEERQRKGEAVTPGQFAYAYAAARDTDATMRLLDSMLTVRDPGLPVGWIDPEFYFLWDNPRYRAWGEKLPWQK
jgi:tetratricopeptide (TPR) repeat protein